MNRRSIFLFAASLFSLIAIPVESKASDFAVQGLVESIRTHDATAHPDWAPPRFWFTLKNITVAGTCPSYGGLVMFVANDLQAYAMVMKAQFAGKALTVVTDDSVRVNTWCAVKFITLQY